MMLNVATASAADLPTGFSMELKYDGLGSATSFDFAPTDLIYVTTKDGLVYVIKDGVKQNEPFLDISDIVNDVVDRGLVEVAVDPDFPERPYIYLAYAYDPPELQGLSGAAGPDQRGRRVSRITRVTADESADYLLAVPDSEEVIVGKNSTYENMGSPESLRDVGDEACKNGDDFVLDCLPSDDYSHIVGGLLFGKDNALYVTSGDGATTHKEPHIMVMRALNLDSLAGKILRVDRDTGQGLVDNPFFDGDPGSNASKVVNYGLRNPFGLAFAPDSEELIMGDVGWHDWEELNRGYGKNFGWPCYEGQDKVNRPNPSYTDLCRDYISTSPEITSAIHAYEHNTVEGSGSITGLGVYTQYLYPPKYHDAIFFTDIVRNNIVAVIYEDGELNEIEDFGSNVELITKIRPAANGNLLFLSMYGSLHELVYTPELSETPTAKITADKTFGDIPLTVSFSASTSSDPNGQALRYKWTFGDEKYSQLESPQHTYQTEGTYKVNLIVKNEGGDFTHESITINAGNSPPTVSMDQPSDSLQFQAGDTVNYSATASDVENELHELKFQWTATASSGEQRLQALSDNKGINGHFSYPDLEEGSHVELCVEVTDEGQLSTKACKRLLAAEETESKSGSGYLASTELLLLGLWILSVVGIRTRQRTLARYYSR